MRSFHPPRRIVTWFNWVLANTAGLGSVSGLFELGQQLLDTKELPEPWALLSGIAVIGCLTLTACAQQLILDRAGLEASFWMAASAGGVFAGLLAGILVGTIAFMLLRSLLGGADAEGFSIVMSIFAAGFVFGGVQMSACDRTWSQSLLWMVANGLVMFPMVLIPGLMFGGRVSSIILFATAAGAIYGVITGICLMRMLPRARSR